MVAGTRPRIPQRPLWALSGDANKTYSPGLCYIPDLTKYQSEAYSRKMLLSIANWVEAEVCCKEEDGGRKRERWGGGREGVGGREGMSKCPPF